MCGGGEDRALVLFQNAVPMADVVDVGGLWRNFLCPVAASVELEAKLSGAPSGALSKEQLGCWLAAVARPDGLAA